MAEATTPLTDASGEEPGVLRDRLARALQGGPALGLGMPGPWPSEVAAGTAVVIATSGSSGIPKRVALSAVALRAGAEATARRVGSGTWLLALPAAYVAGIQVLVRSILAGTQPVALAGRFTAPAFVQATADLGRRATAASPRYTALVPAQLATLLDAADDPSVRDALGSYRAILIGGQALSAPLRERAAELGVPLVRTYGSTETSGGCVYDARPLDTVRVRAVDGELWVAGPMLADGYLGDTSLTAERFIRDAAGTRWYRTGDLGVVHDGLVRVDGRADNVIVSGGVNVSLDRVERIVRDVPGLGSAVVVGVADQRWGAASVIVVGQDAVAPSRRTEVLTRAREAVAAQLGKAARPARVVVVDEVAVLASGKPDRAALGEAVRADGEIHPATDADGPSGRLR